MIKNLAGNACSLAFLAGCASTSSAGQSRFVVKPRFGQFGLFAGTPDAEGHATPFAEDTLAILEMHKASQVVASYQGTMQMARETERNKFGQGFGGTLNPGEQRAGGLRIDFTCRRDRGHGAENIATDTKMMLNGHPLGAFGIPIYFPLTGPVAFSEKAAVLFQINDTGISAPLGPARVTADETTATLSQAGSVFVPAINQAVPAWRWLAKMTGHNYAGQRLERTTETLLSSAVPCRVISCAHQTSYDGMVTDSLGFRLSGVRYA